MVETWRQRREALGLTQAALAHLLGVALSTWCRWEHTGWCPHESLVDLALSELERRRADG